MNDTESNKLLEAVKPNLPEAITRAWVAKDVFKFPVAISFAATIKGDEFRHAFHLPDDDGATNQDLSKAVATFVDEWVSSLH